MSSPLIILRTCLFLFAAPTLAAGLAVPASAQDADGLPILVHGYAAGVFSSRKLERATYDTVAFRIIAANDHPEPTPQQFQLQLRSKSAKLPP